MKKITLLMIVVWSFIGLTIIAALIAHTVFLNGGQESEAVLPRGFGKAKLVADETIPLEGLDQIKLSFSSDECNIYFTNDNSVNIKHYARNLARSRYATIAASGGVLTVSTMPAGFGGFTLFSLSRESIVDITLPTAYKEILDIDLKSGDIRFHGDISMKSLSIELSSGEIRFDSGVALEELFVKVSSGDIRAEREVNARNLNVGVTSGSVKAVGGISADAYSLKSSSGTISVGERLAGSGSVEVTSGTIKLAGVDITETLNAKVSSGTINIGIKGSPGLKFNGKKSSGTIRAYFPVAEDGNTVTATVGVAPYKKLDVSVASGTISINQD